jgi:hypothetical protein
MAASKYSKYVITNLDPRHANPEAVARYAKTGKRILWIDDVTVPGAFQMNMAWYIHANPTGPGAHYHDVPEIIGLLGSDPEHPNELYAEVEFWLEDEKFTLTKSTMIFVPANMKHCPLILHRVDRPILHFTTVTAGKYEIKGMKKK